jgi:predicted signal transduction protein with EAL and GGDEF domain
MRASLSMSAVSVIAPAPMSRFACKTKTQGVRHFENRTIVTILSSQGIYAATEGPATQHFMGTSGVARDISDRKKAEETIAFQAFHDLLTGLPNRILFKDRLGIALTQAKRKGKRLGVMFIDIDRFKLINDSYGHHEGDELLKCFAERARKLPALGRHPGPPGR